jgi:hypothetical protein
MFKLGHTPYIRKQIIEPIVASLATNIMFRAKYKCVEPQHGPTTHDCVGQGLDVALGNVLFAFIHLFTPIAWN